MAASVTVMFLSWSCVFIVFLHMAANITVYVSVLVMCISSWCGTHTTSSRLQKNNSDMELMRGSMTERREKFSQSNDMAGLGFTLWGSGNHTEWVKSTGHIWGAHKQQSQRIVIQRLSFNCFTELRTWIFLLLKHTTTFIIIFFRIIYYSCLTLSLISETHPHNLLSYYISQIDLL